MRQRNDNEKIPGPPKEKNTCPLINITVEVSTGLQNAVYVLAGKSTSGIY